MVRMATAALCAAAVFAWIAVWTALLGRFWWLRKEFEIRARSPSLVVGSNFIASVFSGSVLWKWLLRSVDKALPCYIVFALSYSVLAVSVTPYFIRAVRLVVAYNRPRGKWTKYVKWTPLMGTWAVSTAGYAIRASIFFGTNSAHHSNDARECFYWDDHYLLAFVIIFGCGPMLVLAKHLSKVNDAFGLREELALTIGGCTSLGGIAIFLQVLVKFKLIEETSQIHTATEVLVLLWGTNAGFWSLLVPLVSYQKALWTQAKGAVLPVESDPDVEAISNGVSSLTIARAGGEMRKLFQEFCRRHLCMESWNFIVCVCAYEALGSSLQDDWFDAFVATLDRFFLPTSPEEVNISSAMRNTITEFRAREKFRSLSDDARRTVFSEPAREITRMLDQNLLAKFQDHVRILQHASQSRRAAHTANLRQRPEVALRAGPGGSEASTKTRVPSSSYLTRGASKSPR